MARISMIEVDGRYRVSVRGRLSALDLQRLERACGPALEHKKVPLELLLAGVTSIDDAASAFLERLQARGAVLVTE